MPSKPPVETPNETKENDLLEHVETVCPGERFNRIMAMLVACGRRIGPAFLLDGKVYHPTPQQIDIYVW